MFPIATTGSGCSATSRTSKGEGSSRRFPSFRRVAEKTSKGPQKSRTSTFSKRTMPTRFLSIPNRISQAKAPPPSGSSSGPATAEATRPVRCRLFQSFPLEECINKSTVLPCSSVQVPYPLVPRCLFHEARSYRLLLDPFDHCDKCIFRKALHQLRLA